MLFTGWEVRTGKIFCRGLNLDTFIQVRQLAPLLGLFSKNNTFGPRSRYRKKLPAAAANQIAGNKKISLGMHK